MRQRKVRRENTLFSGFRATHRNKEHEGQWAVRERWRGDEFGFRLSLRYVTEEIK